MLGLPAGSVEAYLVDRDLAVMLVEADREAAESAAAAKAAPVAPRGAVPADGLMPPVGWEG